MGDTPMVLLSSVSVESSPVQDVTARYLLPDLSYGAEIAGRAVKLIEAPDARLAFADFRARLILQGQ